MTLSLLARSIAGSRKEVEDCFLNQLVSPFVSLVVSGSIMYWEASLTVFPDGLAGPSVPGEMLLMAWRSQRLGTRNNK